MDPYIEFLSSLKGATTFLCPYRGNSGDRLILMGTEFLLKKHDVCTTSDPNKADLILYPGGNPTMWHANIAVWEEMWRKFPSSDFVVGPATFQLSWYNWVSAIKRRGRSTRALYARDPNSYTNLLLSDIPKAVQIGLSHDPALALRDSDWLSKWKTLNTEEYDLFAFRTDHEAGTKECMRYITRYIKWIRPNILRQRLGAIPGRLSRRRRIAAACRIQNEGFPRLVCDASRMEFTRFVQTVCHARFVHTDRLHVMLLAAMLGKKVFAHRTSYQKLEAVYQHSMKSWADVAFVQF